jgi:hypothetical protein
MTGESSTVETVEDCRLRCLNTINCNYFNSFSDGTCSLSTGEGGIDTGNVDPTVTAGSADCVLDSDVS